MPKLDQTLESKDWTSRGKLRCRNHYGALTGPKRVKGKARIAKAQLKHDKFVNWREHRSKEKAYFRQIRMLMALAREAGLMLQLLLL